MIFDLISFIKFMIFSIASLNQTMLFFPLFCFCLAFGPQFCRMLFFLFVLRSFVNLNLFSILSFKLEIEGRDFFLLGYIDLVIEISSLKG